MESDSSDEDNHDNFMCNLIGTAYLFCVLRNRDAFLRL